MFYFYIFFAILVLVSTNPISDDFNSDSHDDILIDSSFPSNEITITDSNVVADSGCFSNTVTNENLNDNIQKRTAACPVPGEPNPKSHQQHSTEKSEKSTSIPKNPCNNEYPKWLVCGGPEIFDAATFPGFPGVLNCVHDMFFKVRLDFQFFV